MSFVWLLFFQFGLLVFVALSLFSSICYLLCLCLVMFCLWDFVLYLYVIVVDSGSWEAAGQRLCTGQRLRTLLLSQASQSSKDTQTESDQQWDWFTVSWAGQHIDAGMWTYVERQIGRWEHADKYADRHKDRQHTQRRIEIQTATPTHWQINRQILRQKSPSPSTHFPLFAAWRLDGWSAACVLGSWGPKALIANLVVF